ncbi:MAG TPA: penicillin-binding protein 2 [Acidimicrobiales bacterium]|jgi:cell division protein FtsI (penicillin-binding protein 3)|nr:penicillin-binding protein 2 [Acidimicrobiales bacterium]
MILLAAMLLLVARLVDVQVLHSGSYQAAARGESAITVSLPSVRGGIYARDGSPLALSVPTDDVVADDFQITHPVQTANALAPMLHVPAATLAAQLHQHSGYVILAKQLPQSTGERITADALPGITLLADSKREVPNGNLAAPVVGFTNAAGKGAAGLEYGDNRLLAGADGKETLMQSPGGVTLPQSPVSNLIATTPGSGLELTLDSQLQYESEQALAKAIESSNAVSGTAIVMDVKTGQILSMANLDATHPAALGAATTTANPPGGVVPIGPHDAVDEAPSNLAVTQLYEPGSVFKLVTFSAALQEGIINPNSVFTVPDQLKLDGSTFHDAEPHPTESLTATQILAQSSNIGTSEIAQGVGEQRLLNQVNSLGFGQNTGLDFPGESPGLLATPAQWEPTDYVSLPIGQVDAVNALQVLDAYNTVANGGVYVAPKLVQATISPSGTITKTAASATHQVLSASVNSEVTSMLQQVVNQGTGTSAAVPGYTVAGKTGTAQIPTQNQDSYVPGAYMASFVGFAPAANPTLSIIVVLNRPTPIFGGTVAAPVFSQIMSYALHRYDIPTTPGAQSTTTPPGSTATKASDQAQDIT